MRPSLELLYFIYITYHCELMFINANYLLRAVLVLMEHLCYSYFFVFSINEYNVSNERSVNSVQ
jgi:hypothetical protein